jgi:futalosine hydrolase
MEGGTMLPASTRIVLFLAAVEREVLPLRRRVEGIAGKHAFSFQPRIVVTGVGKAGSACEATIALREERPCLTVQVGCAGALPGSGLVPGDVVISDVEILADEGVETEDGFLDLQRLGLPAGRDGLLDIYNEVPVSCPRFETWGELFARTGGRFTVRSGRMATVSTVSGTESRAREIAARWGVVAENMEGAASALVALRHHCPFFEVRGISNLAGERNRAAWEIDLACDHAAEVAVHIAAIELGAQDVHRP